MQLYKTINSLLIVTMIVLLLFSIHIQCKTVRKKIPVRQLATKSQTVYISRLGLSTTGGQVVIKLNKYGDEFPDLNGLKLGLLIDQDFYSHKNAQSCQQKQQFYKETFRIKFFSPTQGMSTIPISKNNQEHLYFFFVYTCDFVDADEDNQSILGIDLIMTNHGLAISDNGAIFWPYLIMTSLCIGLAYRFHKDVLEFIKMNKNLSSVLMCIGFMIGSFAIFAKFFDSTSNLATQEESQFFSALYNTLKILQEAIMATILVSIAWGWLLNNENYKVLYYSVVGGVTIMNFLSEIISLLNKQQISNQNMYQGVIGKFALILRVIICVIFISGCLYVSLQTIPKRQKFINNYAEVGAVYLLTNLISLLCSSIFVHDYNHGQTIPTLQDILRFGCIVYLCYLFAYPKQVSYEQIGFGVHLEEENNSCIQRQDFGMDMKNNQQLKSASSQGSIMQAPALINLGQPPIIEQGKNKMLCQEQKKIQYLIQNTAFDINLMGKKQENPFEMGKNLGNQINVSMQNIDEPQIEKEGIRKIILNNTESYPQKIKPKTKPKKNKNSNKIALHPNITPDASEGNGQNNLQSSTQYMNKLQSSTQYLSSKVQGLSEKIQSVPEVNQDKETKKIIKAQENLQPIEPKVKANQEEISDDEA